MLKTIAKLKQGYGLSSEIHRKIQDINDKTEEEKLARQKERDLADIEALKKKGCRCT
jgi:hypothetical protein